MGSTTGRDVILRLLDDVSTLKRGQQRVEHLMSAVLEHISESRSVFDRMSIHLEQMLEHVGTVEGRLDAYEERLAALEGRKT